MLFNTLNVLRRTTVPQGYIFATKYIGGPVFCVAATSQTTSFRAVILYVSAGPVMEFQLRFHVFNLHIFCTSNDDSQNVLIAKKVR
jgi:hypothetical protein